MAWYQNPSMCVSGCALRLHWRDLARPLRKGALRILSPEVRWVESLHPLQKFGINTVFMRGVAWNRTSPYLDHTTRLKDPLEFPDGFWATSI